MAEEGLPTELMGWATPQQLGYYEYLRRRRERSGGAKRLHMGDVELMYAQLHKLEENWAEDAAHRRTLDDLCGQLLLDPEQAVPIDHGQAEGKAG